VCGPRSDRPAVWYEVRGRDAYVTVKVCTNNDVITDFGIFTECNSQLCLGSPAQTFEAANCEASESVDYRWFAENNIQYFVHVRSDVIDGIGSNFTIVFEDESLDGPVDDDEVGNGQGTVGGASGQLSGAGFSVSYAAVIVALVCSGVVLFV
jgi:hypothetical protein